MTPKLILASTSQYRKELLLRISTTFDSIKPLLNEEKLKHELLADLKTPLEIAEELALAKALSVKATETHYTIIAGDQLVALNNEIIGKPGSKELAIKQLQQMSGKTHQLITSVVLIHVSPETKMIQRKINHISKMTLKELTLAEINQYVEIDQPYDCAGSYKIESHGIGLFSEVKTDDFTAIQGLPLIWLSQQLKEFGHGLFQ